MLVVIISPAERERIGIPQREASEMRRTLRNRGYDARLLDAGELHRFILLILFEREQAAVDALYELECETQRNTPIRLTMSFVAVRE